MLEETRLLLMPVDAGWEILGTPGDQLLGRARWKPTMRFWDRWVSSSILEVREHFDEPLLMSVRRCWSLATKYEVLDAEGHSIGTFTAGTLTTRRRHAVIGPAGESTVATTLTGETLGAWEREGEGVAVTFFPATDHDPFARMLVLARALLPE
jgi:hypothetical protein